MGRSGGNDALRLIRFEPTVWLVEGDASALSASAYRAKAGARS
jgi:hypothetical protein